jgi:hypothetical protein
VHFEAVMQGSRSADHAFVHRMNLAEVDILVEKHLQFLMARLARDRTRHGVAVFSEDPQRTHHSLCASHGVSALRRSFDTVHLADTIVGAWVHEHERRAMGHESHVGVEPRRPRWP